MGRWVDRLSPRFLSDESGATSIEYGLIISLMFLVIVTAMTTFADSATNIFNTALNAIRDAM